MKQRVLVTGLEGFTGTHLERALLAQGYDVFGTSLAPSNKPNIFTCNITNFHEIEAIIQQIQPSFVIHLAAISFVGEKNTSLIYDVNILGTENLLNALTHLSTKPSKVILASSATVYGNQAESILHERMCPKPVNHYGYSKLIMEHLATTYFDCLPIIITRPFNYTGVGQAEHFLIPKIIKHYKNKLSTIELGNTDMAREFNDVRDIVSWYTLLLTCNTQSEIVNLCTGQAVSLSQIINQMNILAGYTINVKINPLFVRNNEINSLTGSTDKLTQIIQDTHHINFYETLKSMYTPSLI